MTKHEAIKKLITLFGPDAETNEAIKLAMIALVDTLDDTAPAKPKAKAAPKKEAKRKNFDTGKLRALLNGGWSVPKIADEMGVDASTIYYHMKKEGLASDRT